MYVYLWEYRVAPGQVDTFLGHYGPQGSWARLFRDAPGYLGTDLLRDRDDASRFITVDRWASASDHAAFLEARCEAYTALDVECESLTQSEVLIGRFDADLASSRTVNA